MKLTDVIRVIGNLNEQKGR